MTTETANKDLKVIKDEELLRKMWQDTHDFAMKKEIRAQMYKLREERLKNFYEEEIKSSHSSIHTSHNISEKKQQTSETQSHADALKDHSFMSLKSKEIRDSSSPTKDTHNLFKSFLVSADTSDKSSATVHEIANNGETTKHVQSGSRSATKVKDNDIISTCSAKYEDVTYSSEKNDQNDNVETKGTVRNTFFQDKESGKRDENGSSVSYQTSSSLLSSATVVSATTSIGGDINQTSETDSNNYQKKPVENVTSESCITPGGTAVITQTFHHHDGTTATKTKREKTEREVSRVLASTSNVATNRSETNQVRGQVASQRGSLKEDNITLQQSAVPQAEILQASNIETSQVNTSQGKNTHLRDQTESEHMLRSKTVDAEKAAITVNVNIKKSSGNAQIGITQDSIVQQRDTAAECSNSRDIRNDLSATTKSKETSTFADKSSKLITDEKAAAPGSLQNIPDAIVTDAFSRTGDHQISINRKSERENDAEKHSDTTRNDYCMSSRVSVESTPSHQYFASTLRSSSSDRNKNKSNSIKSSNSSLRSSSSPERKLSPHSKEIRPAKSTRTSTCFSTRSRQQHKALTDTRKTSRDDMVNVDVKSRSRSASPAITDTSDFEFVKIDRTVTGDSSPFEKRYDTRGTSVGNIKKISKIEERSYSSPISTNDSKSATSEKPILRRKDAYEGRCKEILGISQNNIKNSKSGSQNKRTNSEFDFSADLIINLKQTEEEDISQRNIKLKKAHQESYLKDMPQVRRSPGKEYSTKTRLTGESSTKPQGSSTLEEGKPQVREFSSQVRRSPEKKNSPERDSRIQLFPKFETNSPSEEGQGQIKEFPPQMRRSCEKGYYSLEGELKDGPSPKPDQRAPLLEEQPQSNEIPCQKRRPPEKKYSPERVEIFLKHENSYRLKGKSPQTKEFPSQTRKSPEKEYSPESDSRNRSSPKPDSRSTLPQERSQISEFPSQIRRSPEKEYSPNRKSRDGSSTKHDRRSSMKEEKPQIKEFSTQTRWSPEKGHSPERELRNGSPPKPDKRSALKEGKPQRDDFSSETRRYPEKEHSLEKKLNDRSSSKPVKNFTFFSEIRRSLEKEYSPERESKERSSPKPNKKSVLINEKPKHCEISSQNPDHKTNKNEIHEHLYEIKQSPEKKHSIKCELVDNSSSKSNIKSSLKQEKPQIKQFPSQSPEKRLCEKSSLKFNQTINLSVLDAKPGSQNSTFPNRKSSEKKSDDEKINIETNKDIKNLSKIITKTAHEPKNQPSAEATYLKEQTLGKQLIPINGEPVHYNNSTHKTIKKDRPVGSPHPKQLEKGTSKSNDISNKENELITISLDRMNVKNMKPVIEPKAVKKFISLLYEAEEDDRKGMKKTSARSKTVNGLESEIAEKKKPQAAKSINRIDIKKDMPKERPDLKLNKMEKELKVTIKPKTKVTTTANAFSKKEVVPKELLKHRNKVHSFTKPSADNKHSNETIPRKKIEKITKIVSIPSYSGVKTKPTICTTTADEKTITNSPDKRSERIIRHVVTAILPVPPLGKSRGKLTSESTNKRSKTKSYTNDNEKTRINYFTTKSTIVNADLDDEKEVVIKLQRSTSSREPTPDRPSAFPCDDDDGIPRYPDQIYEPDDSRCRSEPVNLSEIVIDESEEMVGDKIQEVAEDVSHKANVNKYDDSDECLLSVNEKVKKFVYETQKLISPTVKTEMPRVNVTELGPETGPTTTKTFPPSAAKMDQSPVREQVIITNPNESFVTPKSSRKNCLSEESKRVLSDTGRLRSNESIRKAKQIFENKKSSSIREQCVTSKNPSLFKKEKLVTLMSDDSLDDKQNRSSETTSEKTTSDLSPTSEKKISTKPAATSTSIRHNNDGSTDRLVQKSSNVHSEKRNVRYSKEQLSSSFVKTDDTLEKLKEPFDTWMPIPKQEKIKNLNIQKKVSPIETKGHFSTFTVAVKESSGEKQNALTTSMHKSLEDMYDIELLETLLEQTTDYDLRNKIRTQISTVKRHDSENKQNCTKIIMKNANAAEKQSSHCKETDVATTKQYDLSEPKGFRQNHELICKAETQTFTPSKNTEQTTEKFKFTRKGSVKEISRKFIDNSIETCKNERNYSYPKAGLILRTTSRLVDDDFPEKGKSSAEGNSSNTFLSNTTKVTGVHDIINRIKNAENDALDRNEDEDAQARILLNKFLGCQVLLTGLESSLTSSESTITTIKKTINEGGKTICVELSFRHPISEKDLYDIWDVDILQLLLEKCRHFEEQRAVKARLELVMAEQEARGDVLKTPREELSNVSIHERKTEDPEQEINKENEEKEKKLAVDSKVEFENESEKDSSNEKKTVSEIDEKKSEKNEKGNVENDQEVAKEPIIASATKSRTLPTKTPVSPFAKFRQLDKQSSGSSPSTPNTPTGSRPLFKFTDPDVNKKASTITARLLQWVQMKTKEYENISIDNFSSSWADGLAFCALIHHFLPDAFDYSKLTPKNRRHNFTLAFTVAEEKADVYPLLDVEDMVMMSKPDWKCVFTYVQAIYRRFKDED
ncbi:uncharacterized protein LOC108735419 isoform X2 [Agrilus planipennis]|uniref:Uncharacterized protein LOC108735419 isoform X2 n=1 Tax=Agrilus planipennis TaxID=224129 RepID=A0A7F5RM80_AGRPL|nr:uncharacterized protein LOC108735419 isoform X2 [Agrilus planipennis]